MWWSWITSMTGSHPAYHWRRSSASRQIPFCLSSWYRCRQCFSAMIIPLSMGWSPWLYYVVDLCEGPFGCVAQTSLPPRHQFLNGCCRAISFEMKSRHDGRRYDLPSTMCRQKGDVGWSVCWSVQGSQDLRLESQKNFAGYVCVIAWNCLKAESDGYTDSFER
jgi:hypothetical protein